MPKGDQPARTSNAGGRTLWNAKGGSSSYADLKTPDNLAELVEKVTKDASTSSDERVKPYRTLVTPETLRVPVG